MMSIPGEAAGRILPTACAQEFRARADPATPTVARCRPSEGRGDGPLPGGGSRSLRRIVPSMPTLQLTSLLPFQRRCFPPPLDRPSASYWFSARVALWQAIGALGLKAGDVVAAPAFCCGSELEPFLHAGMKLRFFSVTPELNPDPESFERTLEGASAALATHYFGFPSDLSAAAAACHKRGVILIEDCAH